MNNARRKKINNIKIKLDSLISDIDEMSEIALKSEIINLLQEASSSLEDANDYLDEIE